jgi:nucleoside triphosphate diphosphatase
MAPIDSADPSALEEACIVQYDAARLGFDWPDATGVFAKVYEEIDEIKAAMAEGDDRHARRELGDLLFAVVNLARFLKASPDKELRGTTGRFQDRFGKLQAMLEADGRPISACSLEELDAVWEKVKALEKYPKNKA